MLILSVQGGKEIDKVVYVQQLKTLPIRLSHLSVKPSVAAAVVPSGCGSHCLHSMGMRVTGRGDWTQHNIHITAS